MLESIHSIMARMQQIEQRFTTKTSAVINGSQTAFATVLTEAVKDEKNSYISQMIEKYAAKHGVDTTLAKAVAKIESDNDATAVSEAGALGVMQLMPETASQLGVSNPLNPAENIEGGVRYLKGLLDKYSGNVALALAAYNAGPGSVEKYGGIPPYRETQAYVTKVLDYYKQLS